MSANSDTVLVRPPHESRWSGIVSRWCPQYGHHARILNGSIILLIGSVFVSLANFGYNIGVARMLGPSDFSHAAAAVTILMLISAITLSFQLVCTKLVAKADSLEAKAAVFQHLMKRAWVIGVGLRVHAPHQLGPDHVPAAVESVDHDPAGRRSDDLCAAGSEEGRSSGNLPL